MLALGTPTPSFTLAEPARPSPTTNGQAIGKATNRTDTDLARSPTKPMFVIR
jgi:hypothetical protein